MMNSIVLDNLEALGNRYYDRYLKNWRVDIAENWWTAFRFFFNHAFMRGRRDQLSEEYYLFTMSVLKRYFDIPDNPADHDFLKISRRKEDFVKDFDDIRKFKRTSGQKLSANSIKEPSFNREIAATHPLVNELMTKLAVKGQRALNNDKDLMMVLSALAFLSNRNMPANVHNYMAEQLKMGNADGLSKSLKDIYVVGDKLASFIIRDIVLLNPDLILENPALAFPIDTWVIKVAKRLGCRSEDFGEVREFFISRLEKNVVAKVAAGVWYLGLNSLDIAIANLDKVEMTFEE